MYNCFVCHFICFRLYVLFVCFLLFFSLHVSAFILFYFHCMLLFVCCLFFCIFGLILPFLYAFLHILFCIHFLLIFDLQSFCLFIICHLHEYLSQLRYKTVLFFFAWHALKKLFCESSANNKIFLYPSVFSLLVK